jgi:hypothetical protein
MVTRQTVFIGAVRSHVQAGQLPGKASVIRGELQAGRNSICSCLTGVLL